MGANEHNRSLGLQTISKSGLRFCLIVVQFASKYPILARCICVGEFVMREKSFSGGIVEQLLQ